VCIIGNSRDGFTVRVGEPCFRHFRGVRCDDLDAVRVPEFIDEPQHTLALLSWDVFEFYVVEFHSDGSGVGAVFGFFVFGVCVVTVLVCMAEECGGVTYVCELSVGEFPYFCEEFPYGVFEHVFISRVAFDDFHRE
jgi:hypothetical protein